MTEALVVLAQPGAAVAVRASVADAPPLALVPPRAAPAADPAPAGPPAAPPRVPASRPLPRARRGTLAFLGHARQTPHVYLLADVDGTAIAAARAAAKARGTRLSWVSFVVKAAGDVLAEHPDAAAMFAEGPLRRWRPRLQQPDTIAAKVLFDKSVDGQRCVASGVLRDVPGMDLDAVQAALDDYKDAEIGPTGPFAGAHKLQRLPLPVIRLAYRAALMKPPVRNAVQGTFSVTSIGHTKVRTILPLISGTVGFGVGHVADAPVVRDGRLAVAPVLPLSLSFDHRVIDGALASQVLAEVKDRLDTWEQQS
ncbi:MAG: 2-oxo acid dehydrogenase subunit E2 [Kineosporiaceae bacterium]